MWWRVPIFLHILSVGITNVDRFLFVERNQLSVRGVARSARRHISQPLAAPPNTGMVHSVPRWVSSFRSRLREQDVRARPGEISRCSSSRWWRAKAPPRALYRHFDRIVSADEVKCRDPSVEIERPFAFVREGELLHRQWRNLRGPAAAGERDPRNRGANYRRSAIPTHFPRPLLS